MNVAELKKRLLRGFAHTDLFYPPINQPIETGVGILIIKHVLHNVFSLDTMSYTDDTVTYRGMRYVILNSENQVVYSNKNLKQSPPPELEISLPNGKYTIKIIYIDYGGMAKENSAEIKVIPNKTITYIMEFFVGVYKHEFILGSPDGASIFECDPNGIYENHPYSVDRNVYYKTENIYRYRYDSGATVETLICHNNAVPQLGFSLGHWSNSVISMLGVPFYAVSSEDFSPSDGTFEHEETFEFIGFGTIQNAVPVMASGITTTAQKGIFKVHTKYFDFSGGLIEETNYNTSEGYMPTSRGFPPNVFFGDTYNPDIKDPQWFNIGNRAVLKRENSDGTFNYRLGIPNDEWEEVPDGTYIRDFEWDDDEFYKERTIMKNRGRSDWLTFRNYSGQMIIGGEKKIASAFYSYHQGIGEDQYTIGGFTYFSDDYDQY